MCIYVYGNVPFVSTSRCAPTPLPGKKVTKSRLCKTAFFKQSLKNVAGHKRAYIGPNLHLKPPFCTIFRGESDSDGPKVYFQIRIWPKNEDPRFCGDFLSLGGRSIHRSFNQTNGTSPYVYMGVSRLFGCKRPHYSAPPRKESHRKILDIYFCWQFLLGNRPRDHQNRILLEKLCRVVVSDVKSGPCNLISRPSKFFDTLLQAF